MTENLLSKSRHIIGKKTLMGMVQCMVCLAEKGDDLLLLTISEFEMHYKTEHKNVDFNKLRQSFE